MISPRPLIVFFVVGLACLVHGKDGDELRGVVVLFRHGDRSPLSSWPNDEYFGNSSLWPDGYGQLNNMGKQRHYRLGQWFRERYDGFIPKRYNRSDIYVKSTDVDRTLMSAASNLAGFFPPEGDQVWNENIPWQAIPIHTIPQVQDPILTAKVPCPKHDRLVEEVQNSEEFQNINAQLAGLYQNLSEVTGYSLDKMSVKIIGKIYSTVTIYKEYNLTLPSWVDYYWQDIKEWAPKKCLIPTYTQEMARLRTGPFFDYLINHLNQLSNSSAVGDDAAPKFLMLSAHDTTICDRTNAMGVFPGTPPEFASTVIWEVKTNATDFYLNMYFKNSTGLNQIVIPGCSSDCSLDSFTRILEPLTVGVDQWTQECKDE